MKTGKNSPIQLLRLLIISGFSLFLLVGCEEFEETTSFPSSDNKHVVDVTVGYQGANDPEVWWQHVSLRRADAPVNKGRGNLLVYSSREAPVIRWRDDRTLEIKARDVGYTFDAVEHSPVLDEISLHLLIERSAKNSG